MVNVMEIPGRDKSGVEDYKFPEPSTSDKGEKQLEITPIHYKAPGRSEKNLQPEIKKDPEKITEAELEFKKSLVFLEPQYFQALALDRNNLKLPAWGDMHPHMKQDDMWGELVRACINEGALAQEWGELKKQVKHPVNGAEASMLLPGVERRLSITVNKLDNDFGPVGSESEKVLSQLRMAIEKAYNAGLERDWLTRFGTEVEHPAKHPPQQPEDNKIAGVSDELLIRTLTPQEALKRRLEAGQEFANTVQVDLAKEYKRAWIEDAPNTSKVGAKGQEIPALNMGEEQAYKSILHYALIEGELKYKVVHDEQLGFHALGNLRGATDLLNGLFAEQGEASAEVVKKIREAVEQAYSAGLKKTWLEQNAFTLKPTRGLEVTQ